MKIGILTLPLGHNYGGIMQAYALQTVLQSLGYEVVVVNRRHYLPKPTLRIILLRSLSCAKSIVRKYLLGQKYIRIANPFDRGYNIFSVDKQLQDFVRKNINISKPLYSGEDFNRFICSSGFDAIIVGSDQVWRQWYAPDIHDYFLQDIADDKLRKIVYAASFGTTDSPITEENLPICAKALSSFEKVSVREKSSIDFLKENMAYPSAVHAIDPTLLLKAEDYSKFITKASGNSLFAYILDEDPGKLSIASTVAKEHGLSLEPFYLMPHDEKGNPAQKLPIQQWLSGFANARFVVTDSFHGCVFSIIYRKPFVAIANRKRGLDRFESLLGSLGLMDRLVFSEEEFADKKDFLVHGIDYSKVEPKLEAMRKSSLEFLNL